MWGHRVVPSQFCPIPNLGDTVHTTFTLQTADTATARSLEILGHENVNWQLHALTYSSCLGLSTAGTMLRHSLLNEAIKTRPGGGLHPPLSIPLLT